MLLLKSSCKLWILYFLCIVFYCDFVFILIRVVLEILVKGWFDLNDGRNYEYREMRAWMALIIIYDWKRWRVFYLWRKCTFLCFCSKKSENLNINKLMRQICGFIRQYMEDIDYNHIDNETVTKTLWEKIEFLYVTKLKNNKFLLLNRFISFKYK